MFGLQVSRALEGFHYALRTTISLMCDAAKPTSMLQTLGIPVGAGSLTCASFVYYLESYRSRTILYAALFGGCIG